MLLIFVLDWVVLDRGRFWVLHGAILSGGWISTEHAFPGLIPMGEKCRARWSSEIGWNPKDGAYLIARASK